MSQRRAKEFRDQSIEDLESTIVESKKQLFELKCEKKQAKQLEKPHRLALLKKEIARMLTVLEQKKQQLAQQN